MVFGTIRKGEGSSGSIPEKVPSMLALLQEAELVESAWGAARLGAPCL